MKELQQLEQKLGIKIRNPALWQQVLWGCHQLGMEAPDEARRFHIEENEKLEFLGDAVLGFVIVQYLCETFPDESVGVLAGSKAALVSGLNLARKAKELSLASLANFDEKDLPERSQEILSDLLEAILGALYLDQGLVKTRKVVLQMFENDILETILGKGQRDLKGVLQEIALREVRELPRYDTKPAGDHSFVSIVYLKHHRLGEGKGGTKREAEVAAAFQGLSAANTWFRKLK